MKTLKQFIEEQSASKPDMEDLGKEVFHNHMEEGKKGGLWDNIHAKRKRIAAGSGERMRKPGSKGAPTAQDFKDASESVEMCSTDCCGKPVTECKCGPDCPHCDCYYKNNVNETKAAPKGYHFTRDGKLKRGDADADGRGGKMLRADPLDKLRSKVPPVSENFMDGKGPGKPGDAARHGLKGKSAAELKKIRSSDSASPRKKQLAHWLLNFVHKEEATPTLRTIDKAFKRTFPGDIHAGEKKTADRYSKETPGQGK